MSEKTSGMQSLLNGTELGAYTIIRLIGRGGMGEVYEAYEQRLQRRVAIKVVSTSKAEENGDGDTVRRFMQEARTLAQVNHPNIVTIFAIDKINDTQFIAMEFVDGALLKDVFSLFVLSADEALPMFIQMLEGLRALHDNKILHRDLKPHNLMLRANGQIKIFDFGIAKREGDTANEKTSAGIVVGTLAYLPPEVLFGHPASTRSDLWSIGAIFYECLTGQPLVSLHNIKIKGVRAAADSEVVFPAETLNWIPEDMRAIVARLCEKDPERRYSSAAIVIEDLKRFQASRPMVGPNVYLSLAKSVNNIAQLKAKIDPKASKDPKIKRALALAQITGATSLSSNGAPSSDQPPLDEARLITTEMKDSVTGRRRARKDRSRRKKKQTMWTQIATAGVVGLLILLLFFKFHSSDDGATKQHVNSEEPVAMLTPAENQNLWLDSVQSPIFTWTRTLEMGEFELQVSAIGEGGRILSTDPVQGKSLRFERTLPEGTYSWRLVPMRGQTDAGPAHKFTISYLTKIELTAPEAMQTIDTPSKSHPGQFAVDLSWRCKLGANAYRVQIYPEGNSKIPLRDNVVHDCGLKDLNLPAGSYDWQVRVEEPPVARGTWSELRRMTVRGGGEVGEPMAATEVHHTGQRIDFSIRVPQLRNTNVGTTLRFTAKVAGHDLEAARRNMIGSPTLRWLPVRGADAYEVQIFAGNSERPLVDERLSETEYDWKRVLLGSNTWRVRAFDATGVASKFSARGHVDVRLPAPSLHSGNAGEIAWTDVPLAEKYVVQSSSDSAMSAPEENVVSKTQVKIPAGLKSAYVRVAAADSSGHAIGEFSPVQMIKPLAATLPQGPKLLTPPQAAHPRVGKSGRISVLFSWDKVNNAASYQLEVASDAQFSKILERQETKSHGYLMKEAALKGPVFWRVRAIFPKDRAPASNSAWSTTRNFEVR